MTQSRPEGSLAIRVSQELLDNGKIYFRFEGPVDAEQAAAFISLISSAMGISGTK